MKLTALSLAALLCAGCGSDPADAPPATAAASSSGAAHQSSGSSREPDEAPYPIVFLHGMAGFVSAGNAPFELVYFAGVLDDLVATGETSVFATAASPYAGSRSRAEQIAPQIDAILQRTGKAKVNLVAHSQGGLDARLLASPNGLGYGDRIASITTVSTPHLGTPVADLALAALGTRDPSLIAPAAEALVQLLGRSLYDLPAEEEPACGISCWISAPHTRAASSIRRTWMMHASATRATPDAPTCGAEKQSAQAACCPTASRSIRRPYPSRSRRPPSRATPSIPVVNDGLVSVRSARWGTFVSCLAADHLDEIGAFSLREIGVPTFDHLAFYRALVARLRALSY